MSAAMKHIPVMFAEVMDALAVREGGRYIDGTLGRGGHAAGIAGRGGVVLGIDRDMAAVEACRAKFAQGGAVKTVHGAHGDIAEIAKREGFEGVDGVLLDLGVSSPQLDDPARGFSFRNDGPLDMRMDRTKGESAAELVARASAEELADILRRFGEEPQAKRIAQAIVRRRGERAFETTGDLADFVEKIAGRHGGKHPATRTFQALRMAVNDEEGELARALEGAVEVLARGGRLCVITFESLTD
ncbi:MAG: 16S rRNA (cytosine(1402)-N(4))-methyltransferase RsmH, partial [Kiritimatiellae bacterium]|nr:16S rRNA (cytosine(1402)-N(4))-methyltransferase RsmH [Kiritimatiellia bacterium]